MKLLIQSGADVTIINRAGHDAVFEAEINDKKEVVEWLLGAVDELEKGIGQNEVAPPGPDEVDGMELDSKADKNSSNNASEASRTGVEDIRGQMEGLETNGGASQGG